ncbi:raffinose/stachyose/melibiose transport system permease protein [Lederbergia galactosidilyticus]|uniref:carbohydrate ABC transporter permease n=1 Tax=Lederbergia galactosidilytica TaxID=217031 RepID=UPI001AE81822|nr:carbohydrate ABC transporter permease [Lederbergia galactosidilytica]MBP1916806.1 raffinose/stachyose/melibiose transport system permease protein [Lederbergia galactosidilytica]
MKPNRLSSISINIVLTLFATIAFFPIYMAVLNSFKTHGEIFDSVLALPKSFNFENYINVFEQLNLFGSGFNTLIVTVIGLAGIVICGSLAGYKLARTPGKLSGIIFALFVASMLVPFHSIMITLSQMAKGLGLQGSLVGLGLIYIGLGSNMAVFLYHGFVKSIPLELEEAAKIDGCSDFQIYYRIIFPLLKPITATILILNVLWLWNDFLLPLIMLTDVNNYTLMLSVNMLFGQYNSDWPMILAGLVATALPVLIFYAFFQKHILAGISEGAIK